MKTTLTVLVTTALYATLRYNVFKGVAWSEWPVYVLNKVFALSALSLLMIYALRRRRSQDETAARLLPVAWTLMLLHVGLSLAILNPAYYVKYFEAQKLTWQAGWSMMLGVVAAVGLHKFSRACELTNPVGLFPKIGILAFLSVSLNMFSIPAALTWVGPNTPRTVNSSFSGRSLHSRDSRSSASTGWFMMLLR